MIQSDKIKFEGVDVDGVFYTVEENKELAVLHDSLMDSNKVMVPMAAVIRMFDDFRDIYEFAQCYGFIARWDRNINLFVLEKHPPCNP